MLQSASVDPSFFRPRLVAKGAGVLRASIRTDKDVGERLYDEAKKAGERKRQLAAKLAQEEQVCDAEDACRCML